MAAALLESWQESDHAGRISQHPATLLHHKETQQQLGHVQTELVCSLNGATYQACHCCVDSQDLTQYMTSRAWQAGLSP